MASGTPYITATKNISQIFSSVNTWFGFQPTHVRYISPDIIYCDEFTFIRQSQPEVPIQANMLAAVPGVRNNQPCSFTAVILMHFICSELDSRAPCLIRARTGSLITTCDSNHIRRCYR